MRKVVIVWIRVGPGARRHTKVSKKKPDTHAAMTMRLAILSRGLRLYSTQRLMEEAVARGCSVEVLDPLQLSIAVGNEDVRILNEGWPVEVDAVLPRIGYSITRHGVALVRQFERQGVYVANSSKGITQSRDKLHAGQLLSHNRIPIPTTCYVRTWQDVERAIRLIGGMPVVIKVNEGTQGSGVHLIHSREQAEQKTYKMLSEGHDVLVQQYIEESHGSDVRVLVVGGRAVAAMRRRARGNEFRSNFHRGGIVEPVDLTSEYVDIACRAARLLDLNIAGVDLLESKAGPLVLEVNSSPGLEGIERASGVNVAGAIIEHLMQNHAFSQVELDQLLRSKPNHGVLSLSVNRHPSLVGRQIGDMFRDPSEQVVFAIAREGMHVWRPRRTFVLRAGDELVCYGEFSRIRELLKPWMQEESETSAESSVDPFDEGRDEVPSW